jgi:hypothetical protein
VVPEREPSSPAQNSLWPLALLGILVSLFASLISKKIKDNHQAIHPKDSTNCKGNTAPQQIGFILDTIPSPQQASCPDGGKKRTPAWEKAAVLVALGILGVNAWQSWETRKSAGAAQQAAEAAIAAQRPWLNFDLKLAIPLTHIPDGYDFAVTPRVNKIGRSVASDVSMRIEHRVVAFDDLFKIAGGYKEWCENTKPNVAGLETYFPDESQEGGPWHMNVFQADIKKGGGIIDGKVRFVLLIYGCLSYKFEGSAKLHRTGIVYQLSAKQNNLPYLLKMDETYTMDDLIFNPFPFAWEYAN